MKSLNLKRTLKLKAMGFISKLRLKLCGRHAVAIIGQTSEGLFAVDPEDFGVGWSILKNGEYGREELEIIYKYLRPEDSILVVGAHIGSLAIPISKRSSSVHAIEANPKTFQLLQMNVALNKISNISVMQIAASERNEKIQFLLSRSNSGGSKRVPLERDAVYYYDKPETVVIDAVPLDQHIPNKFDGIIMDIEGSEVFALRGMPRILSETRFLQVEFLPHHLKNVSGVTVSQFLEVIAPFFNQLFVPSRALTVKKNQFQTVLDEMYNAGHGDDGLIFLK